MTSNSKGHLYTMGLAVMVAVAAAAKRDVGVTNGDVEGWWDFKSIIG